MRVLLLRTWIENIGNGFIDKGARAIIERAFPEAEVIEMSGYGNLVATRRDNGLLPNFFTKSEIQAYGESADKGGTLKRTRNIAELVDVDVAILPGCVLYPHVLERYKPVFDYLKENGIPLVLLGAGGGDYEKDTREYVEGFFDDIEPIGLITRDSDAFSSYNRNVDLAYDGIDCAFFIDEWYTPMESKMDFEVRTFDKIDEPELKSSCEIIRANHTPFSQAYRDIWQQIKYYYTQLPFFSQKNIFVSDRIRDYLFIYANATEVHSDRIHACIPALAYGNDAQFWYDTPRGALFEKVLDEDITEQPIQLDSNLVSSKKKEQVENLKTIIDTGLD